MIPVSGNDPDDREKGDDSTGQVLPFPSTAPSTTTEPSAEERAKAERVVAEAQRLSRLAPADCLFQLKGRAEKFGVEETVLRDMVQAIVRERKGQIKRQETEDQRREKQRRADQKQEQQKQQREQDRADKEAQRKRQEKEKEFTTISKLPHAQRDACLAELAKRIDEDPAVLREEFEAFVGGGVTLGDLLTPLTPLAWNVEPWPEPVDIAQLLQEIRDKISKYVAIGAHYLTASVLWVLMAWIHNEVATYSVILDVFSVDEGSGKTLMLGVLFWLTPRSYMGTDFTGPNIYRTIDRDQPTLVIDEADEAFENPQVRRIVNAGWTRGVSISRQVKVGREWQTHQFNVFCPKILGRALLPGTGKAKPLPRATARRCIHVKIWPKRADEHVEEFGYCDDDDFATLRRKLLRVANDQAKAIADTKPTFPAGFNNSVRANWKLPLAIAERAGGDWLTCAREAAEFIAGKIQSSVGAQLFAAFHKMCVERLKQGAVEIVIPSEEAVTFLKDFDPFWANDYRGSDGHSGEITQNKLAALLKHYEIGPEKGTRWSQRGYAIFRKGEWSEIWIDMLARYCPGLPDIRKSVWPGRRKK